jgi:Domain of Unknown Function (DUF1259)
MRTAFVIAIAGSLLAAAPALAAGTDWSKVDQALGKTGADQPGDVHKYALPRSDLHVTLDGIAIKPALALGGWLAFKSVEREAMVMGDLVLTESEINPVMTKLLASGITITAVHNHLLRAQPAVFYMHVAGHGDPVKLAAALRDALGASATPFGTAAAPAQRTQLAATAGVTVDAAGAQPAAATVPTSTAALDLDVVQLEKTIGHKGKESGGVYQFAIPRADTITDAGMAVPPPMGTAIAVNFQPTGGGKAAITGDFVLLDGEVNPVLQTLRQNGIEVTAVHNHMLDEQPRTFFVHFWANDDAMKLGEGLHLALGKVNVSKPD